MRSFAIEEPGSPVPALYATLFKPNLCNDNSNCKADHKDHRCVDFTVHPKPKKGGRGINNNIKKIGLLTYIPALFVKGLDNLPTILCLFLLLVVQSGFHL